MAILARRNIELNWIFILIVCVNKIWYYWACRSAFLNKFKSDSWEPWSPCGGVRAQHLGPPSLQGLFWWLSGVRGWVLSSQLRLSKVEILSVLDLQNSKSWRTRNLDITNRPRFPPNNRLGSQGHILQQKFLFTFFGRWGSIENIF